MKKIIAIIGAVAIISLAAQAQVLLSSGLTSGNYLQTFDSLASSGSSGTWADNTTLLGWYASKAYSTAVTPQTYGPYMYGSYRVDTGGNNSGNLFDYGLSLSANRALGSIASGTTAGGSGQTPQAGTAIGLLFKNDTGSIWSGNIAISYTGEQWRNGGNTSSQTILYFGYGINPSFYGTPATVSALISDPQYTADSTLNFISPIYGGAAGTLDGTQAANQVSLSDTIIGVTLNAGDTLMLRWYDINDAGNDHGGAIDNLSVTFIPEPTVAALGGLGLLALAALRRRK